MTVTLDGETLTVENVVAVARDDEVVAIADSARERVSDARDRIEAVVAAGEPVYGVNTGFGELVNQQIPDERVADLQANLVRSHSAGVGSPLAPEAVRATMVTRINALLKGYSGVRSDVIDLLVAMLNERVHPVVPSRGSLGASGDLAPLAHLALVLVGEGEADVEVPTEADDSVAIERREGSKALSAAGLEPVELRAKEGLALINGTQLTLGLATLLVHDVGRLCRAADTAGALTTEVSMGTTASSSEPIHDARPHEGQQVTARNVRLLTRDSEVVESHRNCDRVQDAYSIRCLPQIHGAVRDAVAHLREAVEVELNSATDNPLVFPRGVLDDRASGTAEAGVVSGGNFHGAPLAHRLDYLIGALTDLAAVSERRVDHLVNPNVQEPHLPPFLADDYGVESGLMLGQYTAASLVAECRSLGRAATDNVSVSGGQEDHVSMSATAAVNARRALQCARQVVSIELLTATEAAEYVDDDLALGAGTAAVYDAVRDLVPQLDGDRRLDGDIRALETLVASGLLDEAIENGVEGVV